MSQTIRRIGQAALDVLLPHLCPGCDREVAGRGLFCAVCFGRTRLIAEPLCGCCGHPFGSAEQGGADGLCRDCGRDRPAFARARAAFVYDEASRNLLLGLKHGDRTDLVPCLTPFLARAGRALLAEADLLLPVPLHWRRLVARRYNQSALLARQLARETGKALLLDGLRRVRATRALGDLNGEQRRRALARAFAVRPGCGAMITGRKLLLIDDVLTSGATADGCARVLRAAGAARVELLTLARALGRD